MRTIALALTCSVAIAAQAPTAVPDASECRLLILTIPRDGWRLTVRPDGTATVNYAALPQTASTAPAVVSFAEFHAAVRGRIAQRPCDDDRLGRVQFVVRDDDLAEPLWCVPDTPFVLAQFDRAWDQVTVPADAVGREHVDMLRAMWSRWRANPGPR